MEKLIYWALAASTLSFALGPSTAQAKAYESFAPLVKNTKRSVVNIRATQFQAQKNIYLDPYQFFLKRSAPQQSEAHALGSGVVVDPSGLILTNYHVIQGASTIQILLADTNRSLKAQIIGTDQKTDLALLKIPRDKSLKAIDWGDSEALEVGDIVLAIGNPFGYAHTVTSGIISAKGRVIGQGPYDHFLQTDASIHPGNSGGPLIDIRGRLVGITSAVSAEGPGIGFAIPTQLARKVMKDLMAYGKVLRPWLGLVAENVLQKDEIGKSSEWLGLYGVMVQNLVIDAPAQKAALRVGDLIMKIDAKRLLDLNDLQKELFKRKPRDTVELTIYRRGEGEKKISLRLGETPANNELPDERDLI